MIAFVCAMPMELQPLRRRLSLRKVDGHWQGQLDGHDVVAVVTGMGTALARGATERLLDEVPDIDRVLVVGITGAVENETPIGTLVVPEVVVNSNTGSEHRPDPLPFGEPRGTMWTTDQLLVDHDVLSELRGRGVVSLDMETAAIAEVCSARGVPWSVVRVISDRASDGSVDTEIFGLSHQDGRPNVPAVLRYVVRHPGRIPHLARLGRGSRLATITAADAAVRAARAFGLG